MAGQRSLCEDCEHYDYDEVTDTYECNVNLDEDEYEKYVSGRIKSCPYYRHYDEYKLVRKQN